MRRLPLLLLLLLLLQLLLLLLLLQQLLLLLGNDGKRNRLSAMIFGVEPLPVHHRDLQVLRDSLQASEQRGR